MTIHGGEGSPQLDEDERCRPAEHVAAMARTLLLMGPLATSISTRQRVRPDQVELIRDLLPALADRHGLRARVEVEDEVLTVSFERTCA